MRKAEGVVRQLRDRVKALRRRWSALPDRDEINRFVTWAFKHEQAAMILRHLAEGASPEVVREAVMALHVPDAGKALQSAVCDAISALVVGDRLSYADALGAAEEAAGAFYMAGASWGWWHGPAGAAEITDEITVLDLAGYLLSVADLFKPACPPLAEAQNTRARQGDTP